MKLVPAFFLLGFSIIRLIYVIAAPNVPKARLERIAARKEAAFSRFKKSKQLVPVRFPPNRRNDIGSHLWTYAKYVRIMSKRFLVSSKAGLESRIVGLQKAFMSNCPSECEVREKRSHLNLHGTGILNSGGIALEKETRRKAVAVFQQVGIAGQEGKALRKWPVLQITASAYEMFRQVVFELVSRIQGMVVNAAPKTMIQSLKDTSSHAHTASSYTEQMKIVLPPAISQEAHSRLLRKQQEKELLSSTYVPELSAVPFVETSPEASPEPLPEQVFNKTPQFHDIKVSASPENTRTTLDNANIYPATVVTLDKTDTAAI